MSNDEMYPKAKQSTIGGFVCDMANCVDHVRLRSIQILAHCPEDVDDINMLYDLMTKAKKPISNLLSKYIVLEEDEVFQNGNDE